MNGNTSTPDPGGRGRQRRSWRDSRPPLGDNDRGKTVLLCWVIGIIIAIAIVLVIAIGGCVKTGDMGFQPLKGSKLVDGDLSIGDPTGGGDLDKSTHKTEETKTETGDVTVEGKGSLVNIGLISISGGMAFGVLVCIGAALAFYHQRNMAYRAIDKADAKTVRDVFTKLSDESIIPRIVTDKGISKTIGKKVGLLDDSST